MNEMAPFNVEQAVRKATPALLGFWGLSGSGKTYSALLVARGLVGPTGKIVVIDTENRRAEFYANVSEPWLHIDFQPPFTPERYRQAMQVAEDAGADIIIIDSGSHVWEGEGGVLDMAGSSNAKGLQKWNAPKMAYKRMLNALLRSRVHVIFCLRGKEHHVQQKGRDGTTEIIHMGQVPIAERNFIFEMTIACKIEPDHTISNVKVPEDLAGAITPEMMLSVQTGEKIAEWVGGAAHWDAELHVLRRNAREASTLGTEQAKLHWAGLSKEDQHRLKEILPELRTVAEAADREREATAEEQPADEDDNPFAASGPQADTEAPGSCLDDGPDTPADTPVGEKPEKTENSSTPASQEPSPPAETKPDESADNEYDTLLAEDSGNWCRKAMAAAARCKEIGELEALRKDLASSLEKARTGAPIRHRDVGQALARREEELLEAQPVEEKPAEPENSLTEGTAPLDYDGLLAADPDLWVEAIKKAVAGCETDADLKDFRAYIAKSEKHAADNHRPLWMAMVDAFNSRADELEKVDA